jgi:hypothetical protein
VPGQQEEATDRIASLLVNNWVAVTYLVMYFQEAKEKSINSEGRKSIKILALQDIEERRRAGRKKSLFFFIPRRAD